MLYLLFLFALIPAVFIYDGLVEGEVQTWAWPIRRSEEPLHFWVIITMYGGFIAMLAYFAISWVASY